MAFDKGSLQKIWSNIKIKSTKQKLAKLSLSLVKKVKKMKFLWLEFFKLISFGHLVILGSWEY